MITKERTKELAKTGGTIYYPDTFHNYVMGVNILKNSMCDVQSDEEITEDVYELFSKCFETQEEAEKVLGENK
jgi:hypothetical protein